MNNGKICVSICAAKANEFIEKIERAAIVADVIELRFDCLDDSRIKDLYLELKQQRETLRKPLLFTFRPLEQGGKRELKLKDRLDFWSWRDDGKGVLSGKTVLYADLADLEIDLFDDKSWATRFKNLFRHAKLKEFYDSFEKVNIESFGEEIVISSFHDFIKVPDKLEQLYEKMFSSNADVAKIAVQTDDATDGLALMKLLERAKAENKNLIPIAMGEHGIWTRILGLSRGAFMTFASLDDNSKTAPGQLTAGEMIDVYRVKELDEKTEIYGLIGESVAHSVSPEMHNQAFKFNKLNAVYVPFAVKDLGEFMRRMVNPRTREIDWNARGFAVTIPHKVEIIKHLDSIDETARKIGAVNTISISEDGEMRGFNTDAAGFVEPLKNFYGDLRDARVAILGAGGAARACVYALQQENARVAVFARDAEKAASLQKDFGVEIRAAQLTAHDSSFAGFDIIVNATPLGMKKGGLENETPATAEQLKSVKLVYDLVYNPFRTRLMREADKVFVPTIGGLAMLVAQGAEQQKIWTGKDAPVKEMSCAALAKLDSPQMK